MNLPRAAWAGDVRRLRAGLFKPEPRWADPDGVASALPSQLRDRVEVVLDRLRPALVADGGNVELLDVAEDGTVRVALQGACAECPAQSTTLRFGLESGLRRAIPEVTGVVGVSEGDGGEPTR